MDQAQQSQQPKGNFVGFHNRAKQKGDKRPSFDGRIAIPGEKEEFRMALWASTDKNGAVMFTGQSADLSVSDSALEQIDALAKGGPNDAGMLEDNNLKLRPGQIVLFRNGYKDEANPKRPDFYGRWNPGNGKLVNVSAWARQNRFKQPMLTGQTQYPLPGKGIAEAAQAQEADMRSGRDQDDAMDR